MTVRLEPAGPSLPPSLIDLEALARAEGIGNVTRLIGAWRDGTDRYTASGALLLFALDDSDAAIGVGGLAQCPNVAGALRVRRFYVAPDWRRTGVASRLAERLMTSAESHAIRLTCNAGASPAAPLFWEAMGFVPTEIPGITHVLEFRAD